MSSSNGPGTGMRPIAAPQRCGRGIRPSPTTIRTERTVRLKNARMGRLYPRARGRYGTGKDILCGARNPATPAGPGCACRTTARAMHHPGRTRTGTRPAHGPSRRRSATPDADPVALLGRRAGAVCGKRAPSGRQTLLLDALQLLLGPGDEHVQVEGREPCVV